MKKRIIKDIVDRCPKDGKPAYHTKCDECDYSGHAWIVDKKSKPLSHKTECLFGVKKWTCRICGYKDYEEDSIIGKNYFICAKCGKRACFACKSGDICLKCAS